LKSSVNLVNRFGPLFLSLVNYKYDVGMEIVARMSAREDPNRIPTSITMTWNYEINLG
jgi:hypothetical protein